MRGPTADYRQTHAGSTPLIDSLEERIVFNAPGDVAVGGPVVRVAYLIPTNRDPQTHATSTLQTAMRWYQEWYRDQMEQNGFGPKTFRFETEADGVTPKVWVVDVDARDDELHADPYGAPIALAKQAGVPVGEAGQTWLLIPESHTLRPDGTFAGGAAGANVGVAVVGSDGLAMMHVALLGDARPYAGNVLPDLSDEPLSPGAYAGFMGSTFGQLASTALGAVAHELTHAMGSGAHAFRNDDNFNGNLIGNGFRGIRGALFPGQFAGEYTRLEYSTALQFSVSLYFNGDLPTDVEKPSLSFSGGTQAPSGGLVHVAFTASDNRGLAAALLMHEGDVVDEMPLSGTAASKTFAVPYWSEGEDNHYEVAVYDTSGNVALSTRTIRVTAGQNHAPRPFVRVLTEGSLPAGRGVTFDASATVDPDLGPGERLTYEWDFNNDGTFDTTPRTSALITRAFATAGTSVVRVRVTDGQGAAALSEPIGIRILPPPALGVTQSPVAAEGESATVAGTLNLGAGEGGTLRVDWGDGVTETFSYAPGTATFSEQHVYADDDPSRTPADQPVIRLRLTHGNGVTDVVSTRAAIHNADPEILAPPDRTAEAGELLTFTAGVKDAGAGDTFEYRWAVVADNGQTVTTATGPSFTFRPTAAGLYVVSASVTDDDGGGDDADIYVLVTPASGPRVDRLVLVNAATGRDIGPLVDGQVINLAELPTRSLAVRADVNAAVESVKFGFDETPGAFRSSFRTENEAPFSLFGDRNGSYYGAALRTGAHRVTATPYGDDRASGQAGEAVTTRFTMIDNPLAVTALELVDAGTNQVLFRLTEGMRIERSSLPPEVNVVARASVVTRSVRFEFDGNSRFRTESEAPFALFGDRDGDYYGRGLSIGWHTIKATPYAQVGAGGSSGAGLSLRFEIVP